MTSKTDPLTPFSALLRDLYRLSRESTVDVFQASAVQLVTRTLRFDSAMWGTGAKQPDGRVTVHSIHLHEQPQEMINQWAEFNYQDKSVAVVTGNQGYVMNVHTPTLHAGKDCSGIRSFNQKFGIETGLIVCGEAPNGLYGWLSLFRADPDRHFSEGERRFFQALWPHLGDALTMSREAALARLGPPTQPSAPCLALVDGRGVIYQSHVAFARLLRQEWPQWAGERLPPELIAALGRGDRHTYRGARVAVTLHKVAGLFFASAKPLDALDRLSHRERAVALQFAHGRAHKEIARDAGVSPETVRTQIHHVYRKLGVRDKGELATLVARCHEEE